MKEKKSDLKTDGDRKARKVRFQAEFSYGWLYFDDLGTNCKPMVKTNKKNKKKYTKFRMIFLEKYFGEDTVKTLISKVAVDQEIFGFIFYCNQC